MKLIRSSLIAVAGLGTLAGSAFAELPAGAEEAITSYGADVVKAVGLLITVGIAIYAVKKLGKKMGWL